MPEKSIPWSTLMHQRKLTRRPIKAGGSKWASTMARLLCNLLDGMMAVEGCLRTNLGEIFNEFPDRLSV